MNISTVSSRARAAAPEADQTKTPAKPESARADQQAIRKLAQHAAASRPNQQPQPANEKHERALDVLA